MGNQSPEVWQSPVILQCLALCLDLRPTLRILALLHLGLDSD